MTGPPPSPHSQTLQTVVQLAVSSAAGELGWLAVPGPGRPASRARRRRWTPPAARRSAGSASAGKVVGRSSRFLMAGGDGPGSGGRRRRRQRRRQVRGGRGPSRTVPPEVSDEGGPVEPAAPGAVAVAARALPPAGAGEPRCDSRMAGREAAELLVIEDEQGRGLHGLERRATVLAEQCGHAERIPRAELGLAREPSAQRWREH